MTEWKRRWCKVNDKFLGLLSICRKGGRLCIGFDPTVEAMRAGKAFVVFTSADLSPKTYSELEYAVSTCNKPPSVQRLSFEMDDWSFVLGKRAGIVGVTDKGLAEALCRQTNMEENKV